MKRRDFVIKSSLASMAVATSTGAFGNINYLQNSRAEVKIGVIGTGARGSGLIPFINEIENLQVVACCDILPFRLKEGLKRAGRGAVGYSSYQKLLDNKDVDAVLIATPFSTHSAIAVDAIAAGKHVYCEKTMAKDYKGIENLLNKKKSSDKIFQTGHQYHSSRLYTHVVDLIKDGKVGDITAFECQWNRNGNWRRPVPDPELERIINWRMYREYSGGLVAELCSHQIDFVNWVLNATPKSVIGVGGIDYWEDGRETFDNIHLIYTYPKGVKATFTCLTSNSMDDYKIKVIGDKGTIILDYAEAWFYPEGHYEKKRQEIDGVSGATIPWEMGKGIPIKVAHANPSKQALMDFRDSIINNKQPASGIVTGAKTAITVQMGIDTMIEDRNVEWNGDILL
ncbi:Gfo/Idh/MocA family protein [Autumnicola psychrophila]|uniref:Gfo/Idh/MocA family oxidoreductase n=1 Tax=Autumnicola psychrophila TaxID=3075592 RepID=A0ABU3DWF3_9FLAO|nr:Gfo/Idh/MocA family oxidoreductase [Zunongwangia sp. F225]MDT0688056.1 Gfo/Idh/MocA family oxidoreductase [Zunongwangia sp. F225]